MIFFNNENPLDDLAEIVRLANPEIAHFITGDTIKVDNLIALDPATNDGFNTQCEVRATGEYEAIGVVVVRYNRIYLRTALYASSYYLHIQIPTNNSNVNTMDAIAPLISKALGTKFKVDGDYRDFLTTKSVAVAKGNTVNTYFDVNPLSIRYVPERVHFKCYGLGKALDVVIAQPMCTPFVRESDNALWFGGTVRKTYGTYPYIAGNGLRSAYVTMANLDFTSVWGTDPNNAIELSDEPDELKYRFTDEAFAKINNILATQGLLPLASRYFNSWSRAATTVNHTQNYSELNYHLYIPIADIDYAYWDLAGIWGEYTTYVNYLAFMYKV